jgi:enoyl-CoA hydratase
VIHALLAHPLDDVAVGVVTIDRQERRNALDLESCNELEAALRDVVGQGARVVVLTGAGGHFCAGADLSSVRHQEFGPALRGVLDFLTTTPVACIAAVAGAALGAGTQLAAACDLRVVEASARFGIPAARLGLMVDHWTVQRIALLAGHGPARAMLVAAEHIDAEAALRIGFAQRSGTLEETLAWAAGIGSLAPLSVAGHKLALNRLEATLSATSSDSDVDAAFARAWGSEDVAEGIAAFSERRPPRFRGR